MKANGVSRIQRRKKHSMQPKRFNAWVVRPVGVKAFTRKRKAKDKDLHRVIQSFFFFFFFFLNFFGDGKQNMLSF